MGLFDFMKKKKGSGADEGISWSLKRRIKKAHNKYTPAEERQAALQGLAEDGSRPAIEALIKRFTFYVEPLTKDEREREYVYDVLLGFGKVIVPLIIINIRESDSIQWQLRLYHDLANEEEVLRTLLEIIEAATLSVTVQGMEKDERIDLILCQLGSPPLMLLLVRSRLRQPDDPAAASGQGLLDLHLQLGRAAEQGNPTALAWW